MQTDSHLLASEALCRSCGIRLDRACKFGWPHPWLCIGCLASVEADDGAWTSSPGRDETLLSWALDEDWTTPRA